MHSVPPFIFITMDYTVEKLKQVIFKNIFEVYDIFKNHFNENFVDLQGLPQNEDITYHLKRPVFEKEVLENDDGTYTITDAVIKSLKRYFNDRVASIYVWWPKVTVTNEYNNSIDIQDLYAKIKINTNGCIPYEYYGFLLNRATYSAKQFNSNYLHSHISRIPTNDFTEFQNPCLGRGPIKQTIVTLKSNNDTAMWMLFCEELSRYVTVESLTGIPYKKLESVGYYSLDSLYQDFSHRQNPLKAMYDIDYKRVNAAYKLSYEKLKEEIKNFTAYYLKHGHLKLSYTQGKFTCSMPFFNFIIDISNCFIAYYNAILAKDKRKIEYLYATRVLNSVFVADNKIYRPDYKNNTHHSRYQGTHVLTFKGKSIRLKILEDKHSTTQKTILIHHLMAQYILDNILNIINFRFTNEHGKSSKGSSKPAKARKTVFYV